MIKIKTISSISVFIIAFLLHTFIVLADSNSNWIKSNIVASVETSVYVNGKHLVLRVQSDKDDELYFALRGFMEQLGYYVNWNGADSSIEMENYDTIINVTAWDAKCEKNGDIIELDAPIFLENGYSYFHQSFITRVLGMNIAKVDRASDSSNRVHDVYIETDINKFWDTLVFVQDNEEFYWRHIDSSIMDSADYLIQKYGVSVLFKGLKSENRYSQYYCINRLVEYYNNDDIRTRAIDEITPFLNSVNETIKGGSEFAISVLSKTFNSPFIVNADGGIKVFALFNNYSDYGSYNELWMIKDDKLAKLHSFTGLSHYIYSSEPIKLSPNKDKIAVMTCSRRSVSINIIDLNNGKISPEIMLMALNKVAADNKDYVNTYSGSENSAYEGGEYSEGRNIKWIDDNSIVFEADLAYNYMDIIEHVIVKYNVLDNNLEYESQSRSIRK